MVEIRDLIQSKIEEYKTTIQQKEEERKITRSEGVKKNLSMDIKAHEKLLTFLNELNLNTVTNDSIIELLNDKIQLLNDEIQLFKNEFNNKFSNNEIDQNKLLNNEIDKKYVKLLKNLLLHIKSIDATYGGSYNINNKLNDNLKQTTTGGGLKRTKRRMSKRSGSKRRNTRQKIFKKN